MVIVGRTAKKIAVHFTLYHIEGMFCSILIQIPRRDEIPRVQVGDLCEGCISLSNAEGLLPAEKAFLYSGKVFIFSAHKGKNKGKYIRVAHKTDIKPLKYMVERGLDR